MSLRLSLVTLAAAGAACGGAPQGAAKEAPAERAASSALRRAIEPLYEQEVLHGAMVVALVEPGAEPGAEPVVTYLGFGRASAEHDAAPGADAIFEIGSVSKVLTALLLAEQVGRGEVALDTAAVQLLPFGFRFPDAAGSRPTLEQLASHRAGLPSLPENFAPPDPGDPYAGYGERELHVYLEHGRLHAPPGTRYAYSNLGAGILGYLLARRLGVPYEDAVRQRVLAPLGLAETWIRVPSDAAPRVVPGTTAGGEPARPWTFDVLAGAGAWRSTARDMVGLVRAALAAAGGGAGPLAEALRRSIAPVAPAGGDMQIALGWHVSDRGVVWHNGMTGGHASFVGFSPASRRGVVVLASTASPLITRIGIGVFDVLDGGPLDLDLRLVSLTAAQLDAVTGTYELADGERLRVERRGAALFVVMGDERVRLYPRSATEFVVLELESTLEFLYEDGALVGFVLYLPGARVLAERVAP